MQLRRTSILYLTIVLTGFSVTASASQTQKGVRACLTSDLVGTWEMKNISAKIKINPNDSFGWPYQRFVFDRRGDFKQMASTTPIEGDKPLIEKFNRAASISRFSLDERGILSITKLESREPERCMCGYATKEAPPEVLAKLPDSKKSQVPHQGDIVLTYMTRGGQPVVIKCLRRI